MIDPLIAFLNLQLVGFILIARGIAGFLLGIGPDGREYYRAKFKTVVTRGSETLTELDAFTLSLAGDRRRVPLDDLLSRSRRPVTRTHR